MRNKTIVVVLTNYIISILILFISLAKGLELSRFIVHLLVGVLGLNIIILILFFVGKTLMQRKESTFELEINGTEDEIKEILRETSAIENQDDKNINEPEFEEWTPNNS